MDIVQDLLEVSNELSICLLFFRRDHVFMFKSTDFHKAL